MSSDDSTDKDGINPVIHWTYEETVKLIRRRESREPWKATFEAFPDRTEGAVQKKYWDLHKKNVTLESPEAVLTPRRGRPPRTMGSANSATSDKRTGVQTRSAHNSADEDSSHAKSQLGSRAEHWDITMNSPASTAYHEDSEGPQTRNCVEIIASLSRELEKAIAEEKDSIAGERDNLRQKVDGLQRELDNALCEIQRLRNAQHQREIEWRAQEESHNEQEKRLKRLNKELEYYRGWKAKMEASFHADTPRSFSPSPGPS